MSDQRLQKLAQVLVRYSLDVKKGDRLAINAGAMLISVVNSPKTPE